MVKKLGVLVVLLLCVSFASAELVLDMNFDDEVPTADQIKDNVDCTVSGKIGKACKLDNNKDYMTFGNKYDNDGSTPLAISFWIKAPKSGLQVPLIDKRTSVDDIGYYITIRKGVLRFDLSNDVDLIRTTGTKVLDDDEWHHVVVVYDGLKNKEGVSFYVDGVKDTKVLHSGEPLTKSISNKEDFIIGIKSSDLDKLNFLFDELKIWNTVLSAEEVKKEFDSYTAPKQIKFCASVSDIDTNCVVQMDAELSKALLAYEFQGEKIDTNVDEKISLSEAATYAKIFDLENGAFSKLEGIEYFVKVTSVKVPGTAVKDLTPLTKMPVLTEIRFDSKAIVDYLPLKSVSKLAIIQLDDQKGDEPTGLSESQCGVLKELQSKNIQVNGWANGKKLDLSNCKSKEEPECSDSKKCVDTHQCVSNKCVELECHANKACATGKECKESKCVDKVVIPSVTKAQGDFDGDGKLDKTKDISAIKAKVKEFVSYIKSLKGTDSLGKEIHKYLRKIK